MNINSMRCISHFIEVKIQRATTKGDVTVRENQLTTTFMVAMVAMVSLFLKSFHNQTSPQVFPSQLPS